MNIQYTCIHDNPTARANEMGKFLQVFYFMYKVYPYNFYLCLNPIDRNATWQTQHLTICFVKTLGRHHLLMICLSETVI